MAIQLSNVPFKDGKRTLILPKKASTSSTSQQSLIEKIVSETKLFKNEGHGLNVYSLLMTKI